MKEGVTRILPGQIEMDLPTRKKYKIVANYKNGTTASSGEFEDYESANRFKKAIEKLNGIEEVQATFEIVEVAE